MNIITGNPNCKDIDTNNIFVKDLMRNLFIRVWKQETDKNLIPKGSRAKINC